MSRLSRARARLKVLLSAPPRHGGAKRPGRPGGADAESRAAMSRDCSRAEGLVEKLFDGEASSAERKEAEAHLENCAACRSHLAHLEFLASIAERARDRTPPEPPEAYWEHLTRRILGRIEEEGSPSRGWLRKLFPGGLRWAAPAVALFASLIVVVAVGTRFLRDSPGMEMSEPNARTEPRAPAEGLPASPMSREREEGQPSALAESLSSSPSPSPSPSRSPSAGPSVSAPNARFGQGASDGPGRKARHESRPELRERRGPRRRARSDEGQSREPFGRGSTGCRSRRRIPGRDRERVDSARRPVFPGSLGPRAKGSKYSCQRTAGRLDCALPGRKLRRGRLFGASRCAFDLAPRGGRERGCERDSEARRPVPARSMLARSIPSTGWRGLAKSSDRRWRCLSRVGEGRSSRGGDSCRRRAPTPQRKRTLIPVRAR